MLGNVIDKVAKAKVFDVPIGKSLLILAAIGVGKGITDIVYSKWPAGGKYAGLIAGGGLAVACKKIGAVERFLGKEGADTLAIGGASAAILSLYDVQGWVEMKLAGLAPATTVAAGGTGAAAGGTRAVGAPQEYLSDVERKASSIRRAVIS